jgi:FkbM family methyltransferase
VITTTHLSDRSEMARAATRPHLLSSLMYNFLLRTVGLQRHALTASSWRWLWHATSHRISCPVVTKIHGKAVILNYGNTYPVNYRLFKSLNSPIVELVYQSYTTLGSPIIFVDIGAAIGDTILLLEQRCPRMIERFYCIDGDPEFFRYLGTNLGHLANGTLLFALLSSHPGSAPGLVRIHGGTASAQGKASAPATTLDALLLPQQLPRLDVLKCDVDGYDGKVLRGAMAVLRTFRPAVVFEWHPILCQQTANPWTDHFEVLEASGYSAYLWFTKFGHFSHFMIGYEKAAVDALAELTLRNVHETDWHYDVVALHSTSALSRMALAELAFAKANN